MCMRSLSEEGKDVIRGYMENGKEYDRKELVAAIKERAERKDEMTEGVIAGVIKMLTASNEIMVVSRGRYKKGIPGKEQNMQEKVTLLFHRFKADLDRMCMVNALNLKEEDLKFIRRLNEISNNLEASIWELEDFGKEKEASGAEKAPEVQVEEVEKEVEKPEKESEPEKKGAGNKKEKKEPKGKESDTTEAA